VQTETGQLAYIGIRHEGAAAFAASFSWGTEAGARRVCVADTVPDTPRLDPECDLWEEAYTEAGPERHDLSECVLTCAGTPCTDPDQADGWQLPNDEANPCYRLLIDDEQASATPLDDLPADCADMGWNLGVAIRRRPFAPIDEGRHTVMSCRRSENMEVDCPGL